MTDYPTLSEWNAEQTDKRLARDKAAVAADMAADGGFE
jgi:hypothetical protein